MANSIELKCLGCKCGKDECFANSDKVCRILIETYPNDNKCPFFKTKEHFKREKGGINGNS